MLKKILSVSLSFVFGFFSIFNMETTALAATSNLSLSNDLYSGIREQVANSIMLNDTISEFEKKFGVSFDIKPQDIKSDKFKVDSEWLDDANSFLDSYNNVSNLRSARVATSQPNNKQLAKADAIMYSIDRAAFSIERNPSLDMGKEAQYMFISHYIDRYNYYWSTEDERLLMDGPNMSGEDGYLADWITSSDRRSYDSYM